MTLPAAHLLSLTAHGGQVTTGAPTVLVEGQPAARFGDMQTCPLVTVAVPHVGGVITFGSPVVLTGGMMQARQTDICLCVGPPNTIALGATTVLVGMEGSFGSSLATAVDGLALAQASAEGCDGGSGPIARSDGAGGSVTEYSPAVTIAGDPEFQAQVVDDLDAVAASPSGAATLATIESSGKSVTIEPPGPGDQQNQVTFKDPEASFGTADDPGPGSGATVQYNPDAETTGSGADPSQHRPPEAGLATVLAQAAAGTVGQRPRETGEAHEP